MSPSPGARYPSRVRGTVRRERIRLLQLTAEGATAPFTPPLLALSPAWLRVIEADGSRRELAITRTHEAVWYGDGPRLRARVDDEGKLRLRLERPERAPIERRLVRIPGGGDHAYFGRWEHAKDRAVLSPKGAGVILDGDDACTLEAAPAVVDVYEGASEGALLALRNVPRGARVVAADGLPLLTPGALISDVAVPELARVEALELHPHESWLRGFPPIGFSASTAGLDVAGVTRAQVPGSPDVARLVRHNRGVAWAAFRPIEPPDDADALLAATLADDLAPTPEIGRVLSGKPASIALSDGRRLRIRGVARERLPRGDVELVVAAVLDDALLVEVCAPLAELAEPTGQRILDALRAFWLGLFVRRADG